MEVSPRDFKRAIGKCPPLKLTLRRSLPLVRAAFGSVAAHELAHAFDNTGCVASLEDFPIADH